MERAGCQKGAHTKELPSLKATDIGRRSSRRMMRRSGSRRRRAGGRATKFGKRLACLLFNLNMPRSLASLCLTSVDGRAAGRAWVGLMGHDSLMQCNNTKSFLSLKLQGD